MDRKELEMKKHIIASLCSLVAVFVGVALALEDIDPPDNFYDGDGVRDVLTAAIAAQSNAGATTTNTWYTPRRVGDILVGSAGFGTNAVWVAKGTTTNDWIQVAP